MAKKINCVLLFLVLGFISVSGQVTIGSGIEPNAGMLLDLKETDTQGVNSTKGLMLPRVNLTNLSNLYPMFLGDADYANTNLVQKTAQDNLHIGLLVYNINQCLSPDARGKGIYTWNGVRWNLINELPPIALGSSTTQYTDQDGQPFFARVFGTAGEWMTQNLRVKRYSDDLVALPAVMATDGDGKKWGYPNLAGAGVASPSVYDQDTNLGFVYNINAIFRSGTTSSLADQGAGGSDVLQQGGLSLCPQGWHLPSDVEWNTLETEMAGYPASYSTLASATAWGGTAWNTSTVARGTHGEAMKAVCLPFPFAAEAGGKSFSPQGGGFNAITLQEGATTIHSATYWTASKNTTANTAWTRYLSQDIASAAAVANKTVTRKTNPAGANDMYAVRCKKTTVFAQCGDPLTDMNGNTYQTASYGIDAGCWITSNLRSTQNSKITVPLTLDKNTTDADVAVYAVPNNGIGTTNSDGYLYTWKAATAGTAAEETLMVGDKGSVKSSIQGICPDGWVLPSDLDWLLLEKEMNEHPNDYSSSSTQSVPWLAAYETATDWRPTATDKTKGWGQSFKADVTINNISNTQPALSSTSPKGFNLRLVGSMQSGTTHSFGQVGNVWTSSAVYTPGGMDEAAKYRGFMYDNSGVLRDNASKTSMLSVRCKLKQ